MNMDFLSNLVGSLIEIPTSGIVYVYLEAVDHFPLPDCSFLAIVNHICSKSHGRNANYRFTYFLCD